MDISIPPELESLGFSPYFRQQWLTVVDDRPEFARAFAARVVGVRRGEYLVSDGKDSSRRAVLAGRLRQNTDSTAPCVGDFVLADAPAAEGLLRIEHVFEARTRLARKSAGTSSAPQVIAANVDLGLVVCALAGPAPNVHVAERALNLRRIERYLVAIREAGVRPLVLVNKADLAEPDSDPAARVRSALKSVDVLAVSAESGLGMSELERELEPGVTAVLVGSSGVGKSTLTNRLLERDAQRVQAERTADARGRHTTTERALYTLPSGAFLIDTPGMRELGLAARDDEDESEAFDEFADILKAAQDCRYRDCRHESEPGCAVQAKILAGELDGARLDHQRKLARELEFQRRRHDLAVQSGARKQWRAHSRAVRAGQRAKEGREG